MLTDDEYTDALIAGHTAGLLAQAAEWLAKLAPAADSPADAATARSVAWQCAAEVRRILAAEPVQAEPVQAEAPAGAWTVSAFWDDTDPNTEYGTVVRAADRPAAIEACHREMWAADDRDPQEFDAYAAERLWPVTDAEPVADHCARLLDLARQCTAEPEPQPAGLPGPIWWEIDCRDCGQTWEHQDVRKPGTCPECGSHHVTVE